MVAPVLCYHRIGGPLELGVTRVGGAVFERQIRSLAKTGWRALTLAEFASPHTTPHDPHTFLLTFDDGYASLAQHAYPVLADVGFTATTFLVTDYVGRTNDWDVRYTWHRLRHLDWPEIEHWKARGFEFASHGATHRRLTWLDNQAAADELSRSREVLMRSLGVEAGRAVAYPFGAADPRVERLAAVAGYELGFGGVRGREGRGGDHSSPLHLPRVPVYVWDVGRTPLGLRRDALGVAGRLVADWANRCAVGTSWMLKLRRRSEPLPE